MIEEFGALVGSGKRAGVVFPEDPVTIVGDTVVKEVPERSRKYASDRSEASPDSAELAHNGDGGGGARKQTLSWLVVVQHKVHGIEAFLS